ncbi:hypothetical protein F2Q65_05705 [Thiohalocapsa marina]|uniref:Uncharacterized protein n=1 Tax=Thiohalocapsa marina TaxID=424902 RepID=A0A5M8FMZ8_9GAMM|nr:hypothetical protein [Thiohalocapsa marina]KAA6186293.1 hypothetical protein F2Q65_05705 [Thiohalocapsa marina]
MTARAAYALLWLGLMGFWVLFAPAPAPDTLGQVIALATLQTEALDPLAIAVFHLLGVLPTAFLALLLFDTGRPSPRPFAIGGYFLGGIILLPYLAIRDSDAPLDPAPNRFVRALGSRTAGVVLLLITLGLLTFGLVAGNPGAFAAQAGESQFIALMTADLIVLTTALHLASATDRQRRGLHQPGGIRLHPAMVLLMHLPLLGPMLYLSVRPTSPTSTAPEQRP